jgi:hypothetical protein
MAGVSVCVTCAVGQWHREICLDASNYAQPRTQLTLGTGKSVSVVAAGFHKPG